MLRMTALLLLMLLPLSVLANEAILGFHSDIQINRDGSLRVVETIEVRAGGNQIKRGIYRDFPTLYRDTIGNVTRTDFELVSVRKGGSDEPFQLQQLRNGVRIYIGEQDVFLEPDVYSYRIEYLTRYQLGHFDGFDELYWNVTGNDWRLPIQQASANVNLPQAVGPEQVKMTGYTGVTGSTERFLTQRVVDQRNYYYESTRPLPPGQGLTIVLNWPAGIVNAPDPAQRRDRFIAHNRHSLIAVAGLLVVLMYYLVVWSRFGKDPEAGVIMPLYRAPAGYSPASTRFISRMDYDKTCFTTALVSLATKGAIDIRQDESKQFVISKTGQDYAAAAGEQVIMDTLFANSDQIELQRAQHKLLATAMSEHERSLREDYEKLYFLSNRRYFMPGILITAASVLLAFSQVGQPQILSSTLFVGMFALVPFLILFTTYRRYLKKRGKLSVASIAAQLGFTGVFFFIAGDLFGELLAELDWVAWPLLISAYIMIALNVLFEQWLKAPTLAGRKLLDQIEGLKLYLAVAEADEIGTQGRPRMSSDIYQQYLPFAIALGVDHAWSQQLDHAIAAGIVSADYAPRGIYLGQAHSSFSGFSDALSGTLNEAVSAASTAPGSSSGSASGSSGGGGGGGGGGGW